MRIALLLLLLGSPARADGGSLCLRVATPGAGEAVSVPGHPRRVVKRFTVQVDDGEEHDVSARAWLLGGLALDGKHRVRVRGDGELRETFFLRFEPGKPALELRYDGGYDSWRLAVPKRACPVP